MGRITEESWAEQTIEAFRTNEIFPNANRKVLLPSERNNFGYQHGSCVTRHASHLHLTPIYLPTYAPSPRRAPSREMLETWQASKARERERESRPDWLRRILLAKHARLEAVLQNNSTRLRLASTRTRRQIRPAPFKRSHALHKLAAGPIAYMPSEHTKHCCRLVLPIVYGQANKQPCSMSKNATGGPPSGEGPYAPRGPVARREKERRLEEEEEEEAQLVSSLPPPRSFISVQLQPRDEK